MLRFIPDSWLEGLLRPFLLADPVAGLYAEVAAPDWRFAFLALLLVPMLAWRRARVGLPGGYLLTTFGLALSLPVWTFAIGNGRYFAWALMLVGPLLVAACALAPLARPWRFGLVLLLLAAQGLALSRVYRGDAWALVRWSGEPLPLQASPLRDKPAVLLTVSGVSYSLLVPLFHPQSRWSNIAGQTVLRPGMPEHRKVLSMLDGPLPKYVLSPEALDNQDLPAGELPPVSARLSAALAPWGLRAGSCVFLRSSLVARTPADIGPQHRIVRGFRVCELGRMQAQEPGAEDDPAAAYADVFDRIERLCPRWFPPGAGQPSVVQRVLVRHYSGSETSLRVTPAGEVYSMYLTAIAPTRVGTIEEVRSPEFRLSCERLPGRYLPPWRR